MFRFLLVFGLLVAAQSQTKITENQVNLAYLRTTGAGPSRIFLSAGAAPTSTTDVDSGETFDAVLYLDSADGKLKILHNDGRLVALEP